MKNLLLITLQRLPIHLLQHTQRQLNIRHQTIASILRKVLPHNHTHKLQLIGMRCHRISRNDPTPLAELMRDRELVEMMTRLGIDAEGDEGEGSTPTGRHDEEAQLLQLGGEVVGCAGEVHHDGAIATLAKADELVVLTDDLRGALREVEGEGCLVGAEVVDVEDELFGEELGGAPDHPADARVDEAVFVAGDVDADNALEAEVPLERGVNEGDDEAAGCSVHVDWDVDVFGDEEVVDFLDVFVFASVGCAEDGADADGVLVDEGDGFFRVDHVAGVGTEGVAFLDVEVAGGLLPAHLNGAVHDEVGVMPVFAFGLALVLPSSLHGQGAQHDGLGGADARGAHGLLVVVVGGCVVETGDHADAAVLDLGGFGVLFVVDEVLAEGFGHEFLGLVFHVGGDEGGKVEHWVAIEGELTSTVLEGWGSIEMDGRTL
jgi:hypothetical protein